MRAPALCVALIRNDIVLLLSVALSGETTQAVTLPSLWIYDPSMSPGVNLFPFAFDYWQTLSLDLWRGSPLVHCSVLSGVISLWYIGEETELGKLTSPSGCTRWDHPGWGATPERSSRTGWATAGLGGKPHRPPLSSSPRPGGGRKRKRESEETRFHL